MTHDITITLDLSPYMYSVDFYNFYIQPDTLISSGNLVIDWGDNTSETASPHEVIEHSYQYDNIYTITIDGVSDIGDGFLSSNDDITEVTLSSTLSSNITTIGDDFCANTHITEIVIPENVTSIGNNFCVDTRIAEIVIPENVTSIGDFFCADSSLNAIHIPSNVATIGNHFCYMCPNLRAVSFSTGLTEIGENFIGNTLVSRLEFPEGLLTARGFDNAPNIHTIFYPSSIDDIGGLVFENGYFNPQKIVFKSCTPPSTDNAWENFNGVIYVPEGCVNDYIEYGTETETFPVDSSYYKENLTLSRALDKFGTLMRTNLKRKGIETQHNDGLTTLINKVNDIETNDMTGFLADIGFYDADNWSGTPPTILKDKLIFNDDSEFSFGNVNFPDTFTWCFAILPQNSEDAFGIGPNVIIHPNDNNVSNIDGYIKYEEMMIISRENGGNFTGRFVISSDSFSILDLTRDYLRFSPATENPIVIQNIYFNEETYPYEDAKIIYNAVFDKDSNIRPSTIPILLSKDNKLVDEYPINDNTEYFLDGIYAPTEQWGCYHYKTIDDTSQYSWIAPSDIGYRVMDTYSVVKHNINDNEEYRVDHYIECDELYGYDEPNIENITSWNHQMDSDYGSFDYEIGDINSPHLAKEWGLTFEYIRLSETNNNIGFGVSFHSENSDDAIFFSLSDDKLHIKIGENVYSSDTLALQDYSILTIYQEINNNQMLRWRVDMNYETVFVYDSNINSNDFDYCTLPMQCYQSNAQIRNFHYWDKKNQKILFYDNCTADKTNQYSILWRTSNLRTVATLTYNSTEQAYTFIGNGGDAFAGKVIPNVRGEDDIKIRCKVKFKNNNVYNQFSIIISELLNPAQNGNWDMFRVWGNGHTDHLQKNQNKWESSVNESYVNQDYCYLEIIKQGTTITYNLYDINLNILKTATLTGLTYTSPYFIIGLNGRYNSENYGKFIKEILVQKI